MVGGRARILHWGLEGINSLASYLVPTYIALIASYGLVWYAKVWHWAPTEYLCEAFKELAHIMWD
jgi:hypothetical protein